MQLFYQKEILTGASILKWFNSAQSSQQRSEASDDEEEELERIDAKVLDKFKLDVSTVTGNIATRWLSLLNT